MNAKPVSSIDRVESAAVGMLLGGLCPALGFILGWWVTAALARYQILPIPERGIALAAFAGLGLGLLLDSVYLKRWTAQFFTTDLRLLAFLYLGCSVMAVAAFMGVPVGNLVLGGLAGAYIGRRELHSTRREVHSTRRDLHSGRSAALSSRLFTQTSLFTAAVTGAEAFAIGLIALNEAWVVDWLQAVSGINAWGINSTWGLGLIVLLCGVLMLVQYWITRTMAWMAYGHNP